MQLYWSLKSLPELADLPKAERKAVLRTCLRKRTWAWAALANLAVMGTCGYIGIRLFVPDPGLPTRTPSPEFFAVFFVVAFLGAFASIQVQAYQVRPVIREHRARHDNERERNL